MAQQEDLIIDQGTDVVIRLECFTPDGTSKVFNNFDSDTGQFFPLYDVYAKIKKTYNTPDSDAISFSTTTLDQQNLDNIIQLSLSNQQTDAMKPGNYVYDVEIHTYDSDIGATIVERILEGKLTVTPSVTK